MTEKIGGNLEMDGQSRRGIKFDAAQLEAARILYSNGATRDLAFVAKLSEFRSVTDLHDFIKRRTGLKINGTPRF